MVRVKTIVDVLFGKKYLLVTNTVCSSVLMAAGDCIEQGLRGIFNQHPYVHDWQRTGNMMIVGFGLGPVLHTFYQFIDGRYPSNGLKSVLRKVTIEQISLSPLNIVLFFYFCGLIEKQNLKECGKELRSKFLEIYTMDCLVWPPSQVFNFMFLSPRFRMLYVNFSTMMYNVLLAYVKYKDREIGPITRFGSQP